MISAWFIFVLTHGYFPISLLKQTGNPTTPEESFRKVAEEVEQKIILAEVELDAWLRSC